MAGGLRIKRYTDAGGRPIGWSHWCPGCRQSHQFNVEVPTKAYPEYGIAGGAQWNFDGNLEHPTFSPSMHIQAGGFTRPDGSQVTRRTLCHYFLAAGDIRFLGDCAHELKGQVVPLPEIPEGKDL